MQVTNVNPARFDAYSAPSSQTSPTPHTSAQEAFAAYQPPKSSESHQERAKRDTATQTIELKNVAETGKLRDAVRNTLTELGSEIKKDPGKYTKIEMDGCYKYVNEGAKRSAAAAEHFLDTYLQGAGVTKDIETGAKRCGRPRDDFRNKHNVEVRVYTNLA
ncbi:hypothetical protein AKI39_03310 [Bordetella sp. H567]|uniref:hypothetical protein n=1 Tax=Bordetella sp. H567 TaxID=1697043 RepID=UPI00081C9781|nr:hypothetical protein [Bordetella sp. H567]AOB29925.1 hypothetical protein AKI39_03310 [Bordetella sp. H567]